MIRLGRRRKNTMAEEDHSQSSNPDFSASKKFVSQIADQLNNWFKDTNPEAHSRVETAMESMGKFAEVGMESVKSATDMLSEFAHDLTGVESFQIIPKQSMALEVDIRCKKEQDIVLRQQVAPFVELYALHLGKRIHFEALVNKSKKGLQLDINDGMSLKMMVPIIGMQTVEVKGSGTMTRDEKGELILSITSKVPGLDTPVTVSVPIKTILGPAQAHLKDRFSGGNLFS